MEPLNLKKIYKHAKKYEVNTLKYVFKDNTP